MKIAEGYLLRQIADTYVVVPLTSPLVDFKSIISLNESGAFLWEKLQQDCDRETLLQAMLAEYDIDEATAAADLDAFLTTLKEANLLV